VGVLKLYGNESVLFIGDISGVPHDTSVCEQQSVSLLIPPESGRTTTDRFTGGRTTAGGMRGIRVRGGGGLAGGRRRTSAGTTGGGGLTGSAGGRCGTMGRGGLTGSAGGRCGTMGGGGLTGNLSWVDDDDVIESLSLSLSFAPSARCLHFLKKSF
jgi:hypothetical protein